MKKRLKQYALGGKVINRPTPYQSVGNIMKNLLDTQTESSLNSTSETLRGLGSIFNDLGNNLVNYGIGNLTGDEIGSMGLSQNQLKGFQQKINFLNGVNQGLQYFSNGGIVENLNTDNLDPIMLKQLTEQIGIDEEKVIQILSQQKIPIEAEGGEIVQTPQGQVQELQGASHEQGGILMNVPKGTEIFSKRLKGANGKTMVERKKYRENKLAQLEKQMKKNPQDKLLRNTYTRIKKQFEVEEQKDLEQMQQAQIQELMKNNPIINQMQQVQSVEQLTDLNQSVEDIENIFNNNIQEQGNVEPQKFYTGGIASNPNPPKNIKYPTNFIWGNIGNVINDFLSSKNPFSDVDFTQQPKPISSMNSVNEDSDEYIFPEEELNGVIIEVNKDTNEDISPTIKPYPNILNPDITDKEIDKFYKPSTNIQEKETSSSKVMDILNKVNPNLTFGDTLGIAGQIYNMYANSRNTHRNRATDTPNINPYKEFGEESLRNIKKGRDYLSQVFDKQKKDIQLARNSSYNNLSNSSRSVNGLRALLLANDTQINQALGNSYAQHIQGINQLLMQEAQLQNQAEQMQMKGEYMRDLADRQDKDAYFKNMAHDISFKGKGMQDIGKTLNMFKQRNQTQYLQNQVYKDFIFENGIIKSRPKDENSVSQVLGTVDDMNNMIDKVKNGEFLLKDKKFYNKDGYEVNLKGEVLEDGDILINNSIEFDTNNSNNNIELPENVNYFEGFTYKDEKNNYISTDEYNNISNKVTSDSKTNFLNGIKNDNFVNNLEKYARVNNIDIDLNDKEQVKKLQKDLGLPEKHQTGNIGKITEKALNDKLSTMDLFKINNIDKSKYKPVIEGITNVGQSLDEFNSNKISNANKVMKGLNQAETNGNQSDTTPNLAGSSAKGRYQIIYSHHENNIKEWLKVAKQRGIITNEEFKKGVNSNNFFTLKNSKGKSYQDLYMEWNLTEGANYNTAKKHWDIYNKNNKGKVQGLTFTHFQVLNHYYPLGAKLLAEGKIDLSFNPENNTNVKNAKFIDYLKKFFSKYN